MLRTWLHKTQLRAARCQLSAPPAPRRRGIHRTTVARALAGVGAAYAATSGSAAGRPARGGVRPGFVAACLRSVSWLMRTPCVLSACAAAVRSEAPPATAALPSLAAATYAGLRGPLSRRFRRCAASRALPAAAASPRASHAAAARAAGWAGPSPRAWYRTSCLSTELARAAAASVSKRPARHSWMAFTARWDGFSAPAAAGASASAAQDLGRWRCQQEGAAQALHACTCVPDRPARHRREAQRRAARWNGPPRAASRVFLPHVQA
jgi:hypothetical protein